MTVAKKRRGRRNVVLLIAAAALALATLQSGAAAGATATASGAKSVNIAHFTFSPASLRIGRGGKVAFTNSSGTTHTATKSGSFDTGLIKPGETKVIRFDHAGSFAYHCKIHPFMKGRIVVQ